ncbi:Pre-rRNA-processing protein TSR2-domain-containing protein [Scheffersomyces amazonensis]|uniref:Pre-rRNA-processing protein TSR2-domain-containing protein n=1 Tax=Scheffersomyces amazonensis TaxID=1078765 RepID=UPI00315CDC56
MTSIDPTDYVEASEGNGLRFNDERQQAKFELGVCMAVYQWEELNTAVENSWGGANSAEKRDWISGIVIELFDEKVVDIQLIEETLLYAMVDEFDTEVDNDSALEIGALIFKFYKDVSIGNYNDIDLLYSKWQEKQSKGSSNINRIHIEEDPNNPDVSDSEEDEEDEGDNEDIPQLQQEDSMEVDTEPVGPIVDEDGFELVQKKGRRGGRR